MSRGSQNKFTHPELAVALRFLRHQDSVTRKELIEIMRSQGTSISEIYLSEIERNQKSPSKEKLADILAGLNTNLEGLEKLLLQRPWKNKLDQLNSSYRTRNYFKSDTAFLTSEFKQMIEVESYDNSSNQLIDNVNKPTLPTSRPLSKSKSMLRSQSKDNSENVPLSNSNILDDDLQELIELYSNLTDFQKITILQMVRTYSKKE